MDLAIKLLIWMKKYLNRRHVQFETWRVHITIGELIKNKDYDYVSYRLTLQDGSDTFAGCFASKGGEIIPLDGDIYSKKEEVLSYEEWTQPEDNIQNGLTVVVKGEWVSG